MRQGIFLRTLLIAIAVSTLARGVSMAALYFALRGFSESAAETSSLSSHYTSMLMGLGIGPILIGTFLLLFSARLERLFLGDLADRPVEGLGAVTSESFVTLLLRLLGVYFICTNSTGLISSILTAVFSPAENVPSNENQLVGEFAAHIAGLILAGLLCFRTRLFTRLVLAR
jgi:hypothetical protein